MIERLRSRNEGGHKSHKLMDPGPLGDEFDYRTMLSAETRKRLEELEKKKQKKR